MTPSDNIKELMSRMRGFVDSDARKHVEEILRLAEKFRYLGKRFTFAYDQDLDRQVNGMLIALSDEVTDDQDTMVSEAIALAQETEDEDEVYAYVDRRQGDQTRQERNDMYCTRLKWYLEAMLAIGFARSLQTTRIEELAFLHINDPLGYEGWKEAMRAADYPARAIANTMRFGKGIQRNPLDGLTLTGQTAIAEAFSHATLLGFRKDPDIIGYRTHRNSSFPCEICDEEASRIHPLTEEVLPVHPRCVCYATPVYVSDLTEEETEELT